MASRVCTSASHPEVKHLFLFEAQSEILSIDWVNTLEPSPNKVLHVAHLQPDFCGRFHLTATGLKQVDTSLGEREMVTQIAISIYFYLFLRFFLTRLLYQDL